MFASEFSSPAVETFQPGTYPKLRHISHRGKNSTWQFALHVHPDLVELQYIVCGRATFILDNQVYAANAGDFLIIDQGVPHALSTDPNDPHENWCMRAEDVHFLIDSSSKPMAAYGNSGEYEDFILQTLRQIRNLSRKDQEPAQAALDHLCASTFALCHHILINSPSAHIPKSKSLAGEILAYINENYDTEIDLEHLSKQFYVSVSHISREFKREFGVSPINFLIDKRLSEARWLLINTDESISSISKRVGYQNVYYFIKFFSKREGLSPAAYRDTYRQERDRAEPE